MCGYNNSAVLPWSLYKNTIVILTWHMKEILIRISALLLDSVRQMSV